MALDPYIQNVSTLNVLRQLKSNNYCETSTGELDCNTTLKTDLPTSNGIPDDDRMVMLRGLPPSRIMNLAVIHRSIEDIEKIASKLDSIKSNAAMNSLDENVISPSQVVLGESSIEKNRIVNQLQRQTNAKWQ